MPLYWLKFPATMTRPSSKISKESIMPLKPVPVSKAVRFSLGQILSFRISMAWHRKGTLQADRKHKKSTDKRLGCLRVPPFFGILEIIPISLQKKPKRKFPLFYGSAKSTANMFKGKFFRKAILPSCLKSISFYLNTLRPALI